MRVADVHRSRRESAACDPHLCILKQLFARVLALPFNSQGVRHLCRLRDSEGYGDRCCQYGNLGDIHSVAPFGSPRQEPVAATAETSKASKSPPTLNTRMS